MSGTLTQAPNRRTAHGAHTHGSSFSDHLTHLPQAARGTTPNILRAAVAATGVLALVAALVVTAGASGARSRITTLRNTDAPSVRAADDFLFRLQDMDAQLINALLANGDTSVHTPRTTSEALYDADRKAADGDLEAATAALAGDRAALDQLHAVSDAYGLYQAQAARVLAEDERDGDEVAGAAPASVFNDYVTGHTILFGGDDGSGLREAAAGLETAGKDAIGSSASSTTDALTMVGDEFLGFGVLLVGGLIALQVLLFRRFHRLVSPALAAATAVALVFMIGGGVAAGRAAHDFHTAESDAFESVLALSEAKATSAGVNADESRWLLAHDFPVQRSEYEQSFLRGENAIAGIPEGTSITDYAIAMAANQAMPDADTEDRSRLTPDSGFGEEFANVTFPGETQQAQDAFTAYNTYVQDDKKLRTMPLDSPKELKAAIDFDTDGDTPGTSDQAFNAYSKALDDVIATNESHFESALPAAKNGIGTWTWLPYLLALLLIGLTVLGLRPRFTEYR